MLNQGNAGKLPDLIAIGRWAAPRTVGSEGQTATGHPH